jgi:hypothetical protein
MPTFEIPDGPTAIDAPRSGDAKNPQPAQTSATYTVNNRSSESVSGSLSVKVDGPSREEWFAIDGESEREFAPGTNTVTVRAKLPPELAEGGYPFRLIVAAVSDPDNDFAEGPTTLAKLGPGATPPPPHKWWLWILIGVVALLAIGGGLYLLLSGGKEGGTTPTPTSPVSDTAQALELARKKTIDWLDAYNAKDVDGLARLTAPPARVGSSPLLLSSAQVRGQYQDLFASGKAAPKILFDSIQPQTIPDFIASITKKPPPTTLEGDFWKSMNIDASGVCVVAKSHGQTYIFMFRRTAGDVQLATVMGSFAPAAGALPPPPPPPPAPER